MLILFSVHGRLLGSPREAWELSLLILGLLSHAQPRWLQEGAEILGADLKSEVQSPSVCVPIGVSETLTGACLSPGARQSCTS